MTEPTKLLSAEEFAELVAHHLVLAADPTCIERNGWAALTKPLEAAYATALTQISELDEALAAANGRTLMVARGSLAAELEQAEKFGKEIGAMYAQVAYALGWDKVEEWSWGSAIGTLVAIRDERDALAAELVELRGRTIQHILDLVPHSPHCNGGRTFYLCGKCDVTERINKEFAAQPQGERGAQP